MTKLAIVTWPDERLTTRSDEVEVVDKDLQNFMNDMLQAMYQENGLGLSAVQVGVMKRVVVIDLGNGGRYKKKGDANPIFLINPRIIKSSKKLNSYKEGCLSFPNQFANIIRAKEVEIEYLDYHGEKQTLKAEGLLATCIQHEIDHLDGVVFVDHISKLKRNILLKKLTNFLK